jgi:predicted GNAT family acetyltransferase
MPTRQMVATDPIAPPSTSLEQLTTGDIADMVSLVEETMPGPFRLRTIELGGYLGVREDGALLAMAGQRMRPPGHGEISAVCTRPTHRGRGIASVLARGVATAIQERGDVPILHVLDENANAIRVYERLGFETRMTFDVLRLRTPPG